MPTLPTHLILHVTSVFNVMGTLDPLLQQLVWYFIVWCCAIQHDPVMVIRNLLVHYSFGWYTHF